MSLKLFLIILLVVAWTSVVQSGEKKPTNLNFLRFQNKSVASVNLQDQEEEEEYDEDSTDLNVRSVSSLTPASELMYDDDEEDQETEEDEETQEEDEQDDPFVCPNFCKCQFKKVGNDGNKPKTAENEAYEDEEGAEERSKRSLDYEEDTERFRIDVECANAGLESIHNLFDEDFPLDQIVFL